MASLSQVSPVVRCAGRTPSTRRPILALESLSAGVEKAEALGYPGFSAAEVLYDEMVVCEA